MTNNECIIELFNKCDIYGIEILFDIDSNTINSVTVIIDNIKYFFDRSKNDPLISVLSFINEYYND